MYLHYRNLKYGFQNKRNYIYCKVCLYYVVVHTHTGCWWEQKSVRGMGVSDMSKEQGIYDYAMIAFFTPLGMLCLYRISYRIWRVEEENKGGFGFLHTNICKCLQPWCLPYVVRGRYILHTSLTLGSTPQHMHLPLKRSEVWFLPPGPYEKKNKRFHFQ